jgi:hypothetical protein
MVAPPMERKTGMRLPSSEHNEPPSTSTASEVVMSLGTLPRTTKPDTSPSNSTKMGSGTTPMRTSINAHQRCNSGWASVAVASPVSILMLCFTFVSSILIFMNA